MKKILSLLSLLMLCIVGLNAQTVLYSWESPEGTPVETGGTAAYVNGSGDSRVNYKNGDYYTICLNGKKANVNDTEPSANAGKVVITLDNELAAGDVISLTAYITKNESKKSSAYFYFEKGGEVESAAFSDEANIDATFNGSPKTVTVTVPEEAAGSKTITMTRGQTGTNLFITKLVIAGERGEEPPVVNDVYTVAGDAEFLGKWQILTANDMELVNGMYVKTYTGVQLTNGYKVEYKVVKNHSWDANWGKADGNNADYTVWEGDGVYTVAFAFNPDGTFEDGSHVMCQMTKQTVPVDLDALKAQLQDAIDKVKAYNISDLADAVAAAEAALNAEDATAQSLAAAALALEAAVKDYAKPLLQKVVTLAETFGTPELSETIASAKEVLSNENASAEDLVAVLEALKEKALPAASALMSQAEAFANSFGYADLVPSIEAVQAVIAGGDIDAIQSALAQLATPALAAAQDALGKISSYAEALGSDELKAAVTEVQANLQNRQFMAAITNLKDIAENKFAPAAKAFMTMVQGVLQESVGKPMYQELATAFANTTALVKNKETTIVQLGEAIVNLVQVYNAFLAANTHYTVVGGFTDEGGIDNVLFGKQWDTTLEDNDLVKGDDGIWTLTKKDVELTNGTTVLYKVVKNHSWDEAYGFDGNNADYTVWEGDGKYDVTFTFNEETKAVACDMKKATEPVQPGVFDYEQIAIEPADRSTVESLQSFTLTFGEQTVTVNAEAKPTLNQGETVVATGDIALNEGAVVINFPEAITAPGNYSLMIEGGILYNGAAIDPLKFDYTIAGGADFTIDPAAGEVESLSTFTITFNNYMVEEGENMKAYLFNTETEAESPASVYVTGAGKSLYVSLDEDVTAPGEYQLNIEGVKRMDTKAEVQLIFDYTVKDATAVDQNYYILGDFWGWDNPKQMEATETENLYTLVIDATLEANKEYNYKLRQGDNWNGYQLPDQGNKQFMVEEEGDYTLTFYANVAEHWLSLEGVKKGVVANPFENVTIDPAEGEVASLSEFVITFANAANAQGSYFDESDKPYVVNADNSFVEYGEFDYGQGFNEVVVRLGAEVATAGDYTLVIPAGTITADDQTNADELKFQYTIKKAETTFEIFVKNVPENFGATRPYVYAWSGEGDNVQLFSAEWPGDKMTMSDLGEGVMGWTWQVTAAEAPQFVIFNNGKDGIKKVQTADLAFENRKVYDLSELKGLDTYTATFTTNAGWDEVYAYAWSGDGEEATLFLGEWPGTKLTAVEGIYTATIEANVAPEKILFNNGTGAQTDDFVFENGKAYEFVLADEWAEAIAAAEALVDEDAVAVGKLIEAINVAKGVAEPNDEDKAALQAAIDQYKADNADQEKDETAKVATDGWKKFDGSAAGVCATQYAPAITTYDGRTANMAECYEGNGNRTGTIIYQDITGLTNGKYKVGFFGNAFSTSQRDGFECTMEDGATDVAYVFANEEKEYITARIATSTTENDFRQFDVEVNDGAIKLGMGKDIDKSTNWHTIQIYQLTWFTTAKEVFAADQEELKALVAQAEALAADETKTEGKDALIITLAVAEEAIADKANWYNIAEIEAIMAGLKAAIADFKKANWYIDFAAGEYYVIDAESGLKMAAGNDWGTRGMINEFGLDLTLIPHEESRTVTFDSRVYNGNNHFLGNNLYMDSSEWGWALEYQGFGFYILEPNSEKYINIDYNNNLVLSDTPREWIVVSKEGVKAALLEEMAAATAENPVDATALIVAHDFNRNDARNAEAWTISEDCTNSNLSGGNQMNNCAESYHSTFTIMQTISGAPAGIYQLTAQGFYRQDEFEGEEAPAAPVFFANGVNGDVPVKTGAENGMSDASESFTNGLYTIEPIEFEVTEDGMIYVGVTAAVANQWVIWDNFQLKYFGPNPFANVTIDPAEGTVESLKEFTLTFNNAQNVNASYGEDVPAPYVKGADEFNYEGQYDYGFAFNEVVVTLADEVNVNGEYTLVIPAGTITADGKTNAKDLTFNYTLVAKKQFTVYVENVPEDFGTPYAYVWNGTEEEGNVVVLSKEDWPGDKMNTADMNDEMTQVTKWLWQITATEAPEYVIFTNADGSIQTLNLEFVDGKVYDLSDELWNNPTAIKAINAEIANGAAVYNMQGVRIDKATRKGLYIVNGKKQVVK